MDLLDHAPLGSVESARILRDETREDHHRCTDELLFSRVTRYQFIRELGRGGMGTVYEVYDRERTMRVALKTLSKRDAGWLMRFKREFRLAADLQHPNIARLHDFWIEEDVAFFTMELVEGLDILRFVRSLDGHSTPTVTERTVAPKTESDPQPGDQRVALPGLGWEPSLEPRLRQVLPQLASALLHLHRRGIVHRDVKPSNVLVTPDGRVVLLDFGISLDMRAWDYSAGKVEGTLSFMAPEQLMRRSVGPPADWYAFGALVHTLLIGRPPHYGSRTTIIRSKTGGKEAAPLSTRTHGVPADLADLTSSLLAHDPRERPRGSDITHELRTRGHGYCDPAGATSHNVFVGRTRELRLLEARCERTEGTSTFTIVRAPSGMGKTALVRRFLQDHPRSLVFWGRCHQRENLPFRAFDAALDGLVSYLLRLPFETRQALAGSDIEEIEQTFPAFAALGLSSCRGPAIVRTPAEQKAASFVALRDLLGRVGRIRRVFIVFDDLQWADPESLELLGVLLERPGAAPRVTFLATIRDDVRPSVCEHLARAMSALPLDSKLIIDLSSRRRTPNDPPPCHL